MISNNAQMPLSILYNVDAITGKYTAKECRGQCNNINILHNIAYDKQQCTNEFIMRSVLHNVNAITANILPQNAEWLATIRLTVCTTLLMKINYVQNRLSVLHNIAYENQLCTKPFIRFAQHCL